MSRLAKLLDFQALPDPVLWRCDLGTGIVLVDEGVMPADLENSPLGRVTARARRVEEIIGLVLPTEVRWPAWPVDPSPLTAAPVDDDPIDALLGWPQGESAPRRRGRRKTRWTTATTPVRRDEYGWVRRRQFVERVRLAARQVMRRWPPMDDAEARARIDEEAERRCQGEEEGLRPLWRWHLADALAEWEEDRPTRRVLHRPAPAVSGAPMPRT